MTIRLDAYTAVGVLAGDVPADGRLGELLETLTTLPLADGVLGRLDGSPETRLPQGAIRVDDLLAVVAPPTTPAPVHANWHELALVAGPYEIRGELPTLPGFDPGRALARPTGEFVLLRATEVSVRGSDRPAVLHTFLWVNRYTVERVAADLDLMLYFPGATGTLTSVGSTSIPGARQPGPATGGGGSG